MPAPFSFKGKRYEPGPDGKAKVPRSFLPQLGGGDFITWIHPGEFEAAKGRHSWLGGLLVRWIPNWWTWIGGDRTHGI